jgi:hypothetical protein
MKPSSTLGQAIPINGMEMYYEIQGDGEPLVLLHGGGGVGSNWELIFTDLMYVVNAPAQFVQVQLSSLYQGEKLAKPPSTITLLIWSYQLGDATFEFSDDQMNTVREFAKRITP